MNRIRFLLLAIVFSVLACAMPAFAQNSLFTYQGRLIENGQPANGNYDMQFHLHDLSTGGNVIGVTNQYLVTVSNGLFTVILAPGEGVFNGATRWLEIAVRTNVNSEVTPPGPFVTLTPRQPITPTPYAVTAANLTGVVPGAGLAGTYTSAVTLNNAGNSFTGNGAGLTTLNASRLATGTVPEARLPQVFTTSKSFGIGAQLLVDSGSALLPGLGFSGDPNTGVFRPATDMLGLTTGGSERMRIDNAGRVGIGTQTPGFPLTFGNAIGDKIALSGASSNHYGLGIRESLLQIHTDAFRSDVAFGYGSSGFFTETARITGTGNLGIGTTTPAAALHILKPGLPPSGLPPGQNGLLMGSERTNGYKWIQSYGGPLVLNGEGNTVGIGTDTPSAASALHVLNPAGTAVFGESSASSGFSFGAYGVGASTGGGGVYGSANASSGVTYGVRGDTSSTQGRGLAALATATSGQTFGVRAISRSTSGRGVYGETDATSGDAVGVEGRSASSSGKGVLGIASSTTGQTEGVRGEAASAAGIGVVARGSGPSGTALSIDNGAIRVPGAADNTSTCVFVQLITSGNVAFDSENREIASWIDHPMTNNDPGAILIITQQALELGGDRWMFPSRGPTAAYDTPSGRWFILYGYPSDDSEGISLVGLRVNVMVVKR
jgi:hypothetical protein